MLCLHNIKFNYIFRQYFKNNSNIWLWGLYGNKKTRGFDILPTIETNSEYGFRYQRIISNGEIGFSYHNRIVGQDYRKIIKIS